MSGTLNSIYDNASYSLRLHTNAMALLQEQVTTGSRINRSSDDPSSAFRVLGLNSQSKSLTSYIDSLSEVISTLEISSSVIDDITTSLSSANTLLTQVTSGIYTDDARARTAEEINDILEQMVQLANTKHSNQYLFGGSNTSTAPYLIERTNGEITSVTYQGSYENRNIEVAPNINSSAFFVGEDIFCSDDRGEPVFTGQTGAQAGTGTSSVTGNIWLTVTGSAGDYTLSIDGGLSTFHTDGTDTNLAVTDSVTGQVLYIDTTEINSTGTDMVSVPGTHDIFQTFITIRDILNNDQGFSESELSELRDMAVDSLEEVRSLLAEKSVSVGSRIGFLEDIKNSLENIQYNTEDETTRLQEADIAQIAIDLSRREVLYEMSLSVIGTLISASLIDFLD